MLQCSGTGLSGDSRVQGQQGNAQTHGLRMGCRREVASDGNSPTATWVG
jgi:hypothetical protein